METPTLYLFVNDYVSHETHPAPITSTDEAVISNNFDYEMLFDGTKRVYIDIGLQLNRVEILYRIGIEFNGLEMEWDDVFSTDFIQPFVDNAVDYCYDGYCVYCDENNISRPDEIPLEPSLVASFTESIISRYVNYRSHDDIANAYLLQNVGLECETGSDTVLLMNCSFAILDQILFDSKAFNNAHNRNVFTDIIPLPRYLTIRDNCLLIEYDDVQLNVLDTIWLFQCFDCALQMLVGEKSDIIKEELKTKGFDNKKVRSYIKTGTKQFAALRKMLQSSNARFPNLEKLPDWNSLFH